MTPKERGLPARNVTCYKAEHLRGLEARSP